MSSLFRIDRRFIQVGDEHVHYKEQPGDNRSPFACRVPSSREADSPSTTQAKKGPAALLEDAEAALSHAREQAEEILCQARLQAQALAEEGAEQRKLLLSAADAEIDEKMQRAELEAVERQELARQKGYEDGIAQAEADVKRRQEADREELRQVLEEVALQRNALFNDYEQDLVALSLALAKKIINTAIKNDDNAYESMIRHALSGMKREGKLTLRVSREAYQRLFAGGTATFALAEGEVCVSVTEDPMLAEDGLLLESELEALDAGVDTQLKNISLAFQRAAAQGEVPHA